MDAPVGALKLRAIEALRSIVDGGAKSVDVVPSVLRGVADNADRVWLKNTIFGSAVLRLRKAHVFGPDVARWIDADEPPVDWPADPIERLVVERSCPRFVVELLVRALGAGGADAFLAASNLPGPITLRANLLQNDRRTLARRLAEEGIVVVDNAVAATAVDVLGSENGGRANLNGSAAFRAGAFEVQDAASQAVVAACAVAAPLASARVVVDLCAGRGGKALGLAAAMGDAGDLYVNDVDDRSLADLRGRVRRLGLRCVKHGLPADGSADVVLIDAPCSSLGVLRRSPDLRFTLRPDDLARLLPLQKQLLQQGISLAKAGGRVVYATCSVVDVENAGAVADVEGAVVEGAELLLPHVHGCDGFFICRLRKL